MNLLRHPLNSRGFTLAETMVVVALIAIMTGFGYSGFSSWIIKERARSAANQLAGDLREARIRSVEKHTSHALVYNYGTNQYNVFMDPDGDLTFESDEGEIELIKADVGKEFLKVTAKHPGPNPAAELKLGFDVRGFPLQQNSILFLSQKADPAISNCVNDDCCKTSSLQNGPSCGDEFCCAVCVSYGEIKVTCNDDY